MTTAARAPKARKTYHYSLAATLLANFEITATSQAEADQKLRALLENARLTGKDSEGRELDQGFEIEGELDLNDSDDPNAEY